MTVPKATMHKADRTEPAEDDVRRPREPTVVKAVPEATGMQRTAKDQLGFRVLPADTCHHSRSNRSINYVGHVPACIAGNS